jgi:hypothetical protein
VTRFPSRAAGEPSTRLASTAFGTRLTSLNPRVYAVATTKEPGTTLAPQGDFIVVVETTGATDGAGGRVLHVDSEGRIVNFWTGCGGSAAQLFEARKGATVLLQPARANWRQSAAQRGPAARLGVRPSYGANRSIKPREAYAGAAHVSGIGHLIPFVPHR